jgi:hypothetical protein
VPQCKDRRFGAAVLDQKYPAVALPIRPAGSSSDQDTYFTTQP